MRTQISRNTFFALTGLTAVLAAVPIAAHANPPTITITGHHDSNTKGEGDGLILGSPTAGTSSSYIVTSTVLRRPPATRLPSTTFDNNQAEGLLVFGPAGSPSAPKPSVTVTDGQFNNNQDGVGLSVTNMTVQDGQFSDNSLNGLNAAISSMVTVNGGTFSGNKQNGLEAIYSSEATIYGGTFTGNQNGLNAGLGASITVAGGTFSGNSQADLWAANGGIITLAGSFRGNPPAVLTGSGSVDVLFPGTKQWQTLTYKTTNGGKIVLKLLLAPSIPIDAPPVHP